MKGNLVGVSTMVAASVTVKQTVKTARKPRRALSKTPQKMERGRVLEASRISSAVGFVNWLEATDRCAGSTYTYELRSRSRAYIPEV